MLGISSKRVGISPKGGSPERRPVSGSVYQEEFCGAIRAEVEARRGRGLKGAFAEAARFFGLTERRVRAAWHGEIRSVSAQELLAVRAHRVAALRGRHEEIAREIAGLALELGCEDIA
ncbi:hypothetical protein AA12717_1384 [Gluconacetobacter sacchari DSM 12717]|uniref:Uncharacterized protein n=2 Tax=Gluconacetobacter sacchari TaxID=92759 RepID=A0A7W4NR29_9PROT|nr:hypothetical protein [Gluconacetobacter sacchari]MBB2159705.1 hypothetical protein [Gluconacetobacter sacchari]GBQ23080.1 hypothetical protein AA12717_1384 [Gluconacetobacter sacchari DSM 12717]